MFETNTTLLKINWRLESRKSFALNKMITRNNEIDRCQTTLASMPCLRSASSLAMRPTGATPCVQPPPLQGKAVAQDLHRRLLELFLDGALGRSDDASLPGRRKKIGMSYNTILPTSLQDPSQPTSSTPAICSSTATATATAVGQHVGKENEVDGKEAGGGSRPIAIQEAPRPPSPGKERFPVDSAAVALSSDAVSRQDPPPLGAVVEGRAASSIAGRWQPPVPTTGGGGGAGGGEVFVRSKRGANSVLNRYVSPRVERPGCGAQGSYVHQAIWHWVCIR